MVFDVRVGQVVRDRIEATFEIERSATGRPNRRDFETGPLEAAKLQFGRFDLLPESMGDSVRHCHVLVPGFSVVVFIGMLVEQDTVEIADFAEDPDYWDIVNDDST